MVHKKKILILMPSMFIGGAERSLLGLLDAFNYEQYDLSLFLYRHEGELLDYIPKGVHILDEIPAYTTFDVPIKTLLFSKKWKYGVARLLSKVFLKLHCYVSHEKRGVWMSMQYIARCLQPLLPVVPGHYDVGISFLGIPNVLVHKVHAKTKIAWNHTDYSILYPDKKYDRKLYNQLDYIISVSEQCTSQFLNVYPELREKAFTIENMLSAQFIHKEAAEVIYDMPRIPEEYLLLSVGRYSRAKNFDNVPFICKTIKESGIKVKWYLIGYGGDEPLIRQKIKEAGVENDVIILGKRINPYPYIKKCDLYVQPSRYEGKCVAVLEAQILQKPVVITRYATSSNQLKENIDGVIVPLDNEGCAKGIVELLKNEDKINYLIENCKLSDYTNSGEISKLYNLMEI